MSWYENFLIWANATYEWNEFTVFAFFLSRSFFRIWFFFFVVKQYERLEFELKFQMNFALLMRGDGRHYRKYEAIVIALV